MNDPVTLLLARHGQTEWHAENRYAGVTDVKLTPTGYLEAEALARRAVEERPVAVICSPLSRSLETARVSAIALGVDPQVEARLREVDFGKWEGKTRDEMLKEDAEYVRLFEDDPVAYPYKGGEPLREAADRAVNSFWDLHVRYAGEKVLVVCHNTLLRLALCLLLGIPLKHYRRRFPKMINVAITEMQLSNQGAALYTLNDTRHLKGKREG